MNKKYLELAVGTMAVVGALASAPAAATAVCAGAAAPSAATIASGTAFIQVSFTARCSANVFLDYDENATTIAVGSASKKGKNVFGGHSNGGGITTTGTLCPATGCTATESSGASAAKLAESSS
jgi:hypothetical protein